MAFIFDTGSNSSNSAKIKMQILLWVLARFPGSLKYLENSLRISFHFYLDSTLLQHFFDLHIWNH